MNRYEIKRVIGEVVVVINRVATLEDLVLGLNDYVYDTDMECGIIL